MSKWQGGRGSQLREYSTLPPPLRDRCHPGLGPFALPLLEKRRLGRFGDRRGRSLELVELGADRLEVAPYETLDRFEFAAGLAQEVRGVKRRHQRAALRALVPHAALLRDLKLLPEKR